MGQYHHENQNLVSRAGKTNGNPGWSYSVLDVEIDRGCHQLKPNNLCIAGSSTENIPLYEFNEVPMWLQHNPYVVSGYRSLLPGSLCLKSLFVWSNESINIWSHLLGFMIFVVLMIYDNAIGVPNHNGSWSDHIIVTLGVLCYQFCMVCSAGYHVFVCHSERASKRWLAVDLTGISIGIIGCYLPAVHYAFYCLSIWRDIYLIIISLLSVAVLVLQLHPHFFHHSWARTRILLYCSLVGYGIIPTVHWVLLSGGLHTELVKLFLPKVTVMYILGVIAFVFYLSKFPERCCPGRFDYLGASHQWWHVTVVVACLWWHDSITSIMDYRIQNPCIS
ncbi:unnamed protein product [Owenia fusiformis]|uniref:Uncharacterized protein n=1 Tax=Owenia fusiformis TaxID=6347 RepID=A0A8S4PMZ3_OWEFU|nr:unnamed protein product [Owenia fusiformis]